MNKKRIQTIAVSMVMLLSFTACESKEEKVIGRLNSLSERVEKGASNFDAEDWAEVFKNLEEIHADMETCEFTQDELREVGRADGRLTTVIAKEGAKVLGRDVSSFLKNFSSFVKGFQEGSMENFKEEDFSDLGDQIMSTLKDIESEWND